MEIKINVPSDLSEITLGQYKRYIKVVKNLDEGETKDTFLSLKILEIFCNVPYKTALTFQLSEVSRIVNIISDLLNQKKELVKFFKLGDTEFGFIPKLDDMTFGEYIDLDNFLGDWDKMEKAMAVLYRPVKRKSGQFYAIKKYEGDTYHDIMNSMPLDAVFSSIVFFYHLGIELSKIMTNYLEAEELTPDMMHVLGLTENGGGIRQFTHSLKAILGDLKILQN